MVRRVVIAGGGTGGHIFMGIAIASELLKSEPSSEIWFAGTKRHLESEILRREGFHHEAIDIAGLNKIGGAKLVENLMLIPKSLFQSARLLKRLRPDLVIGLGGYSSGPVVLMAALEKIPTLIIEPNVIPGIANRLLSFFVDQVAVAFAESKKFFRGKGIETGIPIRSEFLSISPKGRADVLSLLIYGGSQGSHVINQAVCEALIYLKSYKSALRIVHQTGETERERVAQAYATAGMEADVRSFIADMPDEFQKADIIISRSGASTIAELTATGKAAILIPLATATNDHQRKNAESLVQAGAAKLLDERDLTGVRLSQEVIEFIKEPEKITRLEQAAQRLGKRDATNRIVQLCKKLADPAAYPN